MSEVKEYKISSATLKDIINKIPKEKWDEVFDEMKQALKQVNGTIEMVKLVAKSISEANGSEVDMTDVLQFPDEITYVDDGLSQTTVGFYDHESGEKTGEVKFKIEAEK